MDNQDNKKSIKEPFSLPLLRMKVNDFDNDRVRRIKTDWNGFAARFWFVYISFFVIVVLAAPIDGLARSIGDYSLSHFIWGLMLVEILPFGYLMGYYGYKISGKKRNLLYGLFAFLWLNIFYFVFIFIGYLAIYGTAKNELNKFK